ncbi:MAG: GDP-mannose 4,6-dehydratase [Chloroflexi bacterium]|nr:GDP-mannose 4,6-dehydratase [Chloroflexota bacterium]
MESENVLVTGAAGFIGAQVSLLLLRAGYRVVGVDNLNDAYDVRLKEWRLKQLLGEPRFEFQRLDIGARDSVRGLFSSRFTAVVNLAARAGVRQSVENPWAYVETNVTGALNLLDLCREFGVPRFLLASTSSIYSPHNPLPFREDANTDCPLSPYVASKKAAEALAYTYHHLYGLQVTVLRYFGVYGPAGRPDMSIFRFVRWIAEGEPLVLNGDGTIRRDFTYIDDIAAGTIQALECDALNGHTVINLGDDRPVEMNYVIRVIEAAVGRSARIEHRPSHPADVPATWANIEKAKKLLGWQPTVQIEEGIQRVVAWYRANADWVKRIRI